MRYAVILLSGIATAALTSFSIRPKLTVTSSAFIAGQMIPVKYSCEGAEVSPPLHIVDIPGNAKSLAIILHDPDAPVKGGFTHWVKWNVDVMPDIPENFMGGHTGLNSANKNSYKGMCPPSGTHHYYFSVYALDAKLDIDLNTDKTSLEKEMQGHILAEGELMGLYKKSTISMK